MGKFDLDILEVQSFVTSLTSEKGNTVKGGGNGTGDTIVVDPNNPKCFYNTVDCDTGVEDGCDTADCLN